MRSFSFSPKNEDGIFALLATGCDDRTGLSPEYFVLDVFLGKVDQPD